MKSSFVQEILLAVVLVALLTMLLNPFGFFMPGMFVMTLTAVLVLIFGVFASLVWRERPRDEREGVHVMFAGRAAFLAGSTIAVLGIATQSVRHNFDPWLLITLGAMILAKVCSLIYSRLKR